MATSTLTQLLNYVGCPVYCPILYSWQPSPSWLPCLLLSPLWLPSQLPSPRSLPVPFGTSSVQFKLVLLCAQKSPHVLISFPNVAFETVLMLSDSVIDKGPYSSFEEDRQALSLSTPVSSRWSVVHLLQVVPQVPQGIQENGRKFGKKHHTNAFK